MLSGPLQILKQNKFKHFLLLLGYPFLVTDRL